jgi:hypothetical protein
MKRSAAVLFLGACLTLLAADVSAADKFHRTGGTLRPKYHAKCLAEGGHVERVGMLQREGCIHTFEDAGKRCTDGSQCLGGHCSWNPRGPRPAKLPEPPVVGQCVVDDNPFGCREWVEGGKIRIDICVD